MQSRRKLRFTTTFGLLLLGISHVAWGQVKAPHPPGGPKPRHEVRANYVLNSASECGVQIGGNIELGQTTIGEGKVTFHNIGNKDVAAIRMGFDYQVASGTVVSTSGDLNQISIGQRGEAWLRIGKTAAIAPIPEQSY